jgi:hypothetical protein
VAGETHSVQEFCDIAFEHAGMKLKWEGSGVEEVSLSLMCTDFVLNYRTERYIGIHEIHVHQKKSFMYTKFHVFISFMFMKLHVYEVYTKGVIPNITLYDDMCLAISFKDEFMQHFYKYV